MSLAYTFWHRPRPEVSGQQYEQGLELFHQHLAATPIRGFIRSYSFRVPDLPWLPGGGYEDWYVIDGFTALGTLNQAAVDSARRAGHDVLARAVLDGSGGVQNLLLGDPGAGASSLQQVRWIGWFSKRDGVRYQQLLAELHQHLDDGALLAVWQRQMVLGPAPEFRVEAGSPVQLLDADLVIAVPVPLASA